ncbi:hypothetical protein GCM10009527_020710 [Actinomadura nitritigenes]
MGALLVYALGRWRDGLAQTAWLQGTVLNVEDRVGLRQCDLAAPAAVRLNSTVGMQGDPSFSVLVLYDALTGDRFRCVLEGRRRPSPRAGDVHALAGAVDAGRPGRRPRGSGRSPGIRTSAPRPSGSTGATA